MDARSFPTAAAYVEKLVGGLSAHPQCLVKGSVMREILRAPFALELRHALPAEIAIHFEHVPVATSWVPEVHVQAMLLAIFDRFFAARPGGGDAAFVEWAYEENRRLFDTPLYKVIFFVMSPERLMNGVEKRWGTFRRGTTLHVVERRPGFVRLVVRHPGGLYTELLARVRATSFRAAAVCAGAHDARVRVEARRAAETDFVLTWR
jgi:hypothetical protein